MEKSSAAAVVAAGGSGTCEQRPDMKSVGSVTTGQPVRRARLRSWRWWGRRRAVTHENATIHLTFKILILNTASKRPGPASGLTAGGCTGGEGVHGGGVPSEGVRVEHHVHCCVRVAVVPAVRRGGAARAGHYLLAPHRGPPPLVLSGHAASLTPYSLRSPRVRPPPRSWPTHTPRRPARGAPGRGGGRGRAARWHLSERGGRKCTRASCSSERARRSRART